MTEVESNRILDFESFKNIIKSYLEWRGHLYPEFEFIYPKPHYPELHITCDTENDCGIFTNIIYDVVKMQGYDIEVRALEIVVK